MSALNGFLQNHANGCDFYESGFTDYCTCGRFEARQEYKMLLVRIAELTVENERLSNQNFDLHTEKERLKDVEYQRGFNEALKEYGKEEK